MRNLLAAAMLAGCTGGEPAIDPQGFSVPAGLVQHDTVERGSKDTVLFAPELHFNCPESSTSEACDQKRASRDAQIALLEAIISQNGEVHVVLENLGKADALWYQSELENGKVDSQTGLGIVAQRNRSKVKVHPSAEAVDVRAQMKLNRDYENAERFLGELQANPDVLKCQNGAKFIDVRREFMGGSADQMDLLCYCAEWYRTNSAFDSMAASTKERSLREGRAASSLVVGSDLDLVVVIAGTKHSEGIKQGVESFTTATPNWLELRPEGGVLEAYQASTEITRLEDKGGTCDALIKGLRARR